MHSIIRKGLIKLGKIQMNSNDLNEIQSSSQGPISLNHKRKLILTKENLKEEFKKRYKALLGLDYDKFIDCLFSKPPTFIRINPMKAPVKWLRQKNWEVERVAWYKYGYKVIKGPENIGNTVEHRLGLFYVQDAASMVPPVALDPRPGERVLDLTAAPGSKTTQMAEMMRWKGVIVANDISMARINVLSSNVQRMGSINVTITQLDGRFIHKIFGKDRFDKVLLDAPCSSVGEVRRNWSPLIRWSLRLVLRLSKLQKELATAAFIALKPGGKMVYSTCTFDPEENEEVVQHLIELGAEVLEMKIPGLNARSGLIEWNGKKFDPSISKCLRIYPHCNDTLGFFVCLLEKPERL